MQRIILSNIDKTSFIFKSSNKFSTLTRSQSYTIVTDKILRKRYSFAIQSLSVLVLICSFSSAKYYNNP